MATFNTVDELIRILDEDPHLREALRARLLTQELLDLPSAHAAFVAEMHEFVAEMHEFVAEMHEFVAEMREFVAATNRCLDAMDRRMDGLELRIDRGFSRLSDDIGTLKGNYTETAVSKQSITIAFNVGDANGFIVDETTLKPLDRDALVRIAADSGIISDIPQDERASFYVSDFAAEVQDHAGETHYILVEASYTCDRRDRDRAIAHAELMTRLTRRKAWPVIAGVRIDDDIRETIQSGAVLWHQMGEESLLPA